MVFFLGYLIIFFIINIFLYLNVISEFFFGFNIYIFVFILFYFINSLDLNKYSHYDNKIDIFVKYLYIFFKNPSFILNFFFINFKKIFLFLFGIKYFITIKTFIILYKKYISCFLIFWKPLFKKTSYFGFFRSNRSKWIK